MISPDELTGSHNEKLASIVGIKESDKLLACAGRSRVHVSSRIRAWNKHDKYP